MEKPASGLLPGINGCIGVVLSVEDTEEGGQISGESACAFCYQRQ